jgi:hypothetical protein
MLTSAGIPGFLAWPTVSFVPHLADHLSHGEVIPVLGSQRLVTLVYSENMN